MVETISKEELEEQIKAIAREKRAIILAHNYQNDDVQDIADFTGDSLELARIAADTDAAIIVFCGVHFMAESAYILSPDKKVILPDITSGCPLADTADADDVRAMKEKEDATVVTYINSTAAVKAYSDICCTSSNAVRIVQRVDGDRILFVPDRNLGSFVKRFTSKEVILWNGSCPTHDRFTMDELIAVKEQHPDAVVMVHPECKPEVTEIADEILSTGQMVQFVQDTDAKKIIVGTEKGMIHKLKSVAPDIEYILASDSFICPDMKKITLEKIYTSLVDESPLVTVDKETARKAYHCLNKMLELS